MKFLANTLCFHQHSRFANGLPFFSLSPPGIFDNHPIFKGLLLCQGGSPFSRFFANPLIFHQHSRIAKGFPDLFSTPPAFDPESSILCMSGALLSFPS
jgi:hypothetical protein